MWLYLTLLTALLAVGRTEYLDDTYLVMMPKVMRPGQPFDVSVTYTYYGQTEAAQISLALYEDRPPSNNTVPPVYSQGFDMPIANCPTGYTGGCPVSKVLSLQTPDTSVLTNSQYNVTIIGGVGTSIFTNSTTVKVIRKTYSIFVQTDRAMYKPSQTVKFRVVSVDANLKPVIASMNISIHDTADNRIKQWINVQSQDAVVKGELELSDQPPLGTWSIKVVGENTGETKMFEIAEYVLPKVEVTVDVPSYFLNTMEKLTASVSAKYTYGQPVKGKCLITTMFQKYYYDSSDYGKINETKDLTDGKIDFEIPLIQLLRIVPTNRWTRWSEDWARNSMNYRTIEVSAICTEELTGKTFNNTGEIPVRNRKFELQFLDITPDNFKPGLNYTAFIKINLPDGTPPTSSDLSFPNGSVIPLEVRDREYYVYRGRGEQGPANWTASFDASGLAVISFKVPANRTSSLDLTASFNDGTQEYPTSASKYANPFKSRDNQSIQVSLVDSTGQLKVGDEVKFQISTSELATKAYFQLLSKSKLAYSQVVSSAQPTLNHTVTLTLTDDLAQKLAPKGRAIVYFSTQQKEIISDSLDFGVDGAFANDVSIQFSKKQAKPAESVEVLVTAEPQSYVGLLALDQSALLLASGNDLSRDEVIEEIEQYDSTNTNDYYGGFGPRPFFRKKRSSWCWGCYMSTGGKDTKEVFDNSGVLVLTDRFIYVEPPPRPWWWWGPQPAPTTQREPQPTAPPFRTTTMVFATQLRATTMNSVAGMPGPPNVDSTGQANVPIRSKFPETWLWTDSMIGADGQVTIQTTAPDTITSWVASAFAMHSTKGLGISADTAKVTVFKQFFISLDLPYSIIRGEEVEVKVVVFNYLSTEVDVLVTLEKSLDFALKEANGLEYHHAKATATLSVPAGDGKSFSIWILPRVLGNIPIEVKAQSNEAADGVRRMLLVEAEGAPQEYSANFLVDLTDSETYEDSVPLELPTEGVVEGSVRIDATALGDLMGPSISGLDNLVRMPSGCGEQNMLKFAPNIFVMDYMNAVGKEDPELKDKATKYMEKGYQRELTYKHYDGSYSAFGNRDPSGSTWLTAFVVKSFCEAREYITVDPSKIAQGLNWIMDQQTVDGNFAEPGRVIHSEMQGGAASGVSMTGYVTVTLLEACFLDTDQTLSDRIDRAVGKAIEYLLSKYDDGAFSDDSYVLSIVAYALAKAEHERADEILGKLNSLAKEENGMKNWAKQIEDNSWSQNDYDGGRVVWVPPRRQATASAIETTSYGLLTLVAKNMISEGIPVMKWLVSMRNSLGGYSSTQDTVMALQALAAYASQASASGQQDVSVVLSAAGIDYPIPNPITPTNSLVLQKIDLTAAQNEVVTVRATGKGMAVVQVSVQYNVDDTFTEPGMNMEVTSTQISDGVVHVEVCSWYTGEGPSGMVVLEVTPLSGYTATNLEELRKQIDGLQRAEQMGKKFVFYFNELLATRKCLTVHTERVNMVSNVKKALVTSYVYYTPTVKRTNFYLPRQLLGKEVCAACPECCTDSGVEVNLTNKTDMKPTGKPKDKFNTVDIIHHTRKPNQPNFGEVLSGNGAGNVVSMVMVVIATFLGVLLL